MSVTKQARQPPERVEIERLDRMPYLAILTYPKPNLRAARVRIRQLRELGVRTVIFEGRPRIGRLGLLGIGTVGLVVKAEAGGDVCALKIRRTDANRESMEEEFRLTRLANRVGVGATALGRSNDLLLLRFLEGPELEFYVRGASGRGTASRVREAAHSILNQCRKLDLIGLDHGELSNLRKHVIMHEGRPYIIDFESASQKRSVRNVTSAAQHLFLGSSLSPRVRRILSLKDGAPVLEALRRYKREMSDENYVRLLATFGAIT